MLGRNDAIERGDRIVKAARAAQGLIERLPDDMPGEVDITNQCEVAIRIPYSWRVYRKVRNKLGHGWRQILNRRSEDESMLFIDLEKDGEPVVAIFMASWREGSTCHRVKIGERQVTQSIYKVVCE
jgi:hypothetical protein